MAAQSPEAKNNTDRQALEIQALLEILALGKTQIEQGKVAPAKQVIARLRARKSGATNVK